MFAINALKKDMTVVEKMLAVVEDFTDGREFRLCDIPIEKRTNYKKGCEHGYLCHYDFTGASMDALVRRGLAEVVGKEDYIWTWEDWRGKSHKEVGTRRIYKLNSRTIDDYKKIMARAITLAVVGE